MADDIEIERRSTPARAWSPPCLALDGFQNAKKGTYGPIRAY
jgi:hypothetical protein